MPDAKEPLFRINLTVLYAGMASMVLVVVLAAVAGLAYMHQQARMRAAVATENLAKTMALTFDGMIDSIDVALLACADEAKRQMAAGQFGQGSFNQFLLKQQERLPVVPYLRATDERGDIVYGAGVRPPYVNVLDREYFAPMRDSSEAGLLVSRPLVGRVGGEWVWVFARRINRPDGAFGGLVYAVLKIDQLNAILDKLSLDRGGSIVLRHEALDLIAGRAASYPSFPLQTGERKVSPQFLQAIQEAPHSGTYRSSQTSMGTDRYTFSYQHSEKYGFNVIAGELEDVALEEWYGQAGIIGALSALIAGLSLVFMMFVGRAWRRQARALAKIQESQSLLREAQEVAGIGSMVYEFRGDRWQGSDILDRILGVDADYPRDLAHLLALADAEDRREMRAELEDIVANPRPIVREVAIHRHDDGRRRWVQARFEVRADAGDAGGGVQMIGTLQDITEAKLAEEEIRKLAYYDVLTGLPNRRLLLGRLQQALATSTRRAQEGALILIDLDNFKTLNDTRGHELGDLLLIEVAERLSACLRETDTVARLGGDEFIVMIEDLPENADEAARQAEVVGEKIRRALGRPYLLAGLEHHSTPSIGIALFAGHQHEIEELMKRADTAMYQAKAAGRNAVRFFDPAMQAKVSARAQLEAELRQAIAQQQFLLHYQAQVDSQGHVIGVEVLARWPHPVRGWVPPAEFIPIAEESGLILPLGQWVLETACAQLALWAASPACRHLTVAVNVSARQFHQSDFVAQVLSALGRSGVQPAKLKLELTEGMLVENAETVISHMAALKAHGVGFSLDDFGTGYSSLSYLKRLPLDQLKIDRSFVRDVLSDSNDAAIARTIIALGQTLGMDVIAEGVETEEQRDFLAAAGCHAYQGYYFSKPLPLEDFEALLRSSEA